MVDDNQIKSFYNNSVLSLVSSLFSFIYIFSVTFITCFFVLLSKEQGMIVTSPNRFLLASAIRWELLSSSCYQLISDAKLNWWLVISGTPQALTQRLLRFNVFINSLHDEVACTLSKIREQSEVGVIHGAEGKAATEMDLDKLEEWADRNLM